ncbi:pyruvate dehydrogenase (acetyl-transferring) kinase isozyme 2, mitochondrial-like isoform X2 [Symsagittifera roscoffensis]|uniref:pyruvate dehydrogenase (acetyl-transferring) kinase isozyme 2, mitochondrial-like isoform X2 n=1 Tax=Symsagittifera roscoffensis TaxID=84072 RepID=UPI00307BBDC4
MNCRKSTRPFHCLLRQLAPVKHSQDCHLGARFNNSITCAVQTSSFNMKQSRNLSSNSSIPRSIDDKEMALLVDKYAKYSPSPLSVQNFIDFGSRAATEKSSYFFLRKEIPVRLANIIKEISYLPPRLLKMPSIDLVRSWYLLSLRECLEFSTNENPSPKAVKKFTEAVTRIRNRHNTVVKTVAEGILELKATSEIDNASDASIQYFLDRFYMMRISIRMLLLQHIFISEQEEGSGFANIDSGHPRFVGLIDPECNISHVIEDAYENARDLCEEYYLVAPGLQLKDESSCDVKMAYIPSHLHHMAFELFKNAMRATVEYHGKHCEHIPPVTVTIAQGPSELSIKISDRGGGFPHPETCTLFKYLYTTAKLPMQISTHGGDSTPLAGYGYGLPLSRIYARYFNGDLILCPQEGLGTDAIIYLNAFSSRSFEHLPVFNSATKRQYLAPQTKSDWTHPPSQKQMTNSSEVEEKKHPGK